MASRTTTDPIEILLEMGVDLDNLSEEEDYLSALKEAIATIQFQTKGAGDDRQRILQEEVIKIRKQRKAADVRFAAKKKTISSKALKTSAITTTKKPVNKKSLLALPPGVEEESGDKKGKKKKPERNYLAEIAKSVSNIVNILQKQYDLKKKSTEEDRRRSEKEKRKLQESGLEKRFKNILKTAEKIIAPVRSIFDRILSFLANILLAKFLTKIIDWIANPDNQSKINSIIRFFTDNWPKLLSAYILFGTSIGKFSRFLVKVLARGAIRLAAASAGLLAKLFGARSLGKFSRFLGRRGKLISAGIEAVTTVVAFKALEGAFTTGLGSGESANIDSDIPVQGYRGGGFVRPIIKLNGGGGVNLKLIAPTNNILGYEGGSLVDYHDSPGEVYGPSGIDKVPAMLTDGEFVMSRGAVQKYGVAQLEAMNAAGGGTNKPKVSNGTVFAVGGGPIFAENRSDQPTNIIKRFVMGDESTLNLIALGKYGEAMRSLGIKIDKNTNAINQNTNQRKEDNKNFQGLQKFINNRQKDLESAGPAITGFLANRQKDLQSISQSSYSSLSNTAKGIKDFVGGKVKGVQDYIQNTPYLGENLAIERERRLGLMEPGADSLTKETRQKLKDRDEYVRSLYDPEKDKGFIGSLKKIRQDVENKGLILDPFAALGLKEEGTEKFVEKMTGGRVKNLGAKITGLQFALKGLAGPLGRAFRIDDRGSLGRYLKPAMEYAQSQGHSSVGAVPFGQEKYNELVGDKIANLALGQTAFTVDNKGRAKTQDTYDSNNTAEYYFKTSRKALSSGNISGALFNGLSGLLRVNQNTGWGNLRPGGNDIDLGGGYAPTDSRGKLKSKEQLAKENFGSATSAPGGIGPTLSPAQLAPSTPKVTAPPPPSNKNGSNVTVVNRRGRKTKPSGNTGGSNVPSIDAGNGNKSKWNILGIPLPF